MKKHHSRLWQHVMRGWSSIEIALILFAKHGGWSTFLQLRTGYWRSLHSSLELPKLRWHFWAATSRDHVPWKCNAANILEIMIDCLSPILQNLCTESVNFFCTDLYILQEVQEFQIFSDGNFTFGRPLRFLFITIQRMHLLTKRCLYYFIKEI